MSKKEKKVVKKIPFNEWYVTLLHTYDIGVITGMRDDLSEEDNKENNSILKSKLLRNGHWFTKFNNGGKEYYFVFDNQKVRCLYDVIIILGKEFKQEHVIFQKKRESAIDINLINDNQVSLKRIISSDFKYICIDDEEYLTTDNISIELLSETFESTNVMGRRGHSLRIKAGVVK